MINSKKHKIINIIIDTKKKCNVNLRILINAIIF